MERDICLVATAQRPNCSYNKGYITLWPVSRMRKTRHISTTGLKSDVTIVFLDPDFL